MNDTSTHQIGIAEILTMLPHRYPFIFIDRVVEYEIDKRLVALKNVTINEPYFVGHFPGNPIMPGVLILEALAQACAILAHLSYDADKGLRRLHYFAGIDNARFKQVVKPGDQLRLEVELVARKRDIWRMHGDVLVNGKLACSADLMSAAKEVISD